MLEYWSLTSDIAGSESLLSLPSRRAATCIATLKHPQQGPPHWSFGLFLVVLFFFRALSWLQFRAWTRVGFFRGRLLL